MSEGNRHIHQLCEVIHSEESNQLMDEDRQSRSLRLTRLDDFSIKSCLGQSTTARTARYGCSSIVYDVKRTDASEGVDVAVCFLKVLDCLLVFLC